MSRLIVGSAVRHLADTSLYPLGEVIVAPTAELNSVYVAYAISTTQL